MIMTAAVSRISICFTGVGPKPLSGSPFTRIQTSNAFSISLSTDLSCVMDIGVVSTSVLASPSSPLAFVDCAPTPASVIDLASLMSLGPASLPAERSFFAGPLGDRPLRARTVVTRGMGIKGRNTNMTDAMSWIVRSIERMWGSCVVKDWMEAVITEQVSNGKLYILRMVRTFVGHTHHKHWYKSYDGTSHKALDWDRMMGMKLTKETSGHLQINDMLNTASEVIAATSDCVLEGRLQRL